MRCPSSKEKEEILQTTGKKEKTVISKKTRIKLRMLYIKNKAEIPMNF